MKANYIAKRSVWSVKGSIFWGVLLFFLIIPLINMIVKIIEARKSEIQFFDNKVVVKSGLFTTHERQSALTKIMSVSVKKTLWGQMFKYGNIELDVVGKWDVDLSYIQNPEGLKNYIETVIEGTDYSDLKQLIHN